MYTPGAVSSLIHLETSSTEKSKEQKKLDKLFGWQKTKSPVGPAPAFASPVSSDVSKDISLDFNPPDKKKKKLYKNGDVGFLNVKNECPSKIVKEKKSRHEKDENVDSAFLKKVKKSKEKNLTENEDKKNRKRKKNSEEKKSEFFGNEIEKNDDNEFLLKKKKLKTNEFEKKEKKKVKKLSDNNNNVHGQEKALNSKFSIKSNELNKKEEKKLKKLSDRNKNNNNNVHSQEKALNSKVPVINDVLSALQGKDGLKSRKRNPKRKKEKDLSDLEESEEEEEEKDLMAKKRSKKRKRDKKNDFKTVFVGNLPLTITMKHLKKLFSSSCGEVESVRLRGAVPANPERGKKYAILKKDFHSKCKSINAYICFCDKQSADKACEVMNGQEVGGQIIRVNNSIIDKKGHDHKRSVFVGNLPFVVSEDDVRKHFLDCGSVVNVRLVKDWKTGIGKGFGYVKFEEVDGAELAVKLDGSKLNKRKIRVYPSEADPKKQKEARDTKRRSQEKTKVGNSRRGGAGGDGGDGKNFEKKGKLKKSDQKEFVGIKAEKKKKKKPKHLARKMGLTSKKKDASAAAVKPVEKSTGGPNKHMVFE